MTAPTRPPAGGDDAPRLSSPVGDGQVLDLEALATSICRAYSLEFPDEQHRYGAAGNAWCVHDNQYLLHWAVESIIGFFDINQEIAWLANVLAERNFPTDRLARTLEIASEILVEQLSAELGVELAAVLTGSAAFVRSGAFIDYAPEE